MQNSEDTKREPNKEAKLVRINRIVPSDMRSAFANHFVVRHTSTGEFHLFFFELDAPIRLGEQGEEEIDELDAHCVAKVAVTQETMGSIIATMAENFEKKLALQKNQESHTEATSTDGKNEGDKHAV